MKKSTHNKKILKEFLYRFGGPRKVAYMMSVSHSTLYDLINPKLNKRLTEEIAIKLYKFSRKKRAKLDIAQIDSQYKNIFTN